MSRICMAWISLNSNGSACSAALAAGRSSDARMVAMTSSMTLMALRKPSTMWARSWALRRRNSERRVSTSTWWSTYACEGLLAG